jgi:exodeoxyribonuclease-3
VKIATFNVNSVKARLPNVLDWLRAADPDVVCLQEIKCVDDAFPRLEFEAMGYSVATHGQKTYNGVALLSKHSMEDVRRGLPGFEDEQARYIEAVVSVPGAGSGKVAAGFPPDPVTIPQGEAIRVCGVYFPNGNPAPGPKYDYKLAFMAALTRHVAGLLKLEEKLVVVGDYNIIPEPRDAKFPDAWAADALALPESRAAYRRLLNLGFTEAIRAISDAAGLYTFWDYQAGAWQRDNGIRIDHLLLSPRAADSLRETGIDKDLRAEEKPSDHVPVWCRLG